VGTSVGLVEGVNVGGGGVGVVGALVGRNEGLNVGAYDVSAGSDVGGSVGHPVMDVGAAVGAWHSLQPFLETLPSVDQIIDVAVKELRRRKDDPEWSLSPGEIRR
jgi:hypothetical protein